MPTSCLPTADFLRPPLTLRTSLHVSRTCAPKLASTNPTTSSICTSAPSKSSGAKISSTRGPGIPIPTPVKGAYLRLHGHSLEEVEALQRGNRGHQPHERRLQAGCDYRLRHPQPLGRVPYNALGKIHPGRQMVYLGGARKVHLLHRFCGKKREDLDRVRPTSPNVPLSDHERLVLDRLWQSDLDPERGWEAQGGIRKSFAQGHLDAHLFSTQLQQAIVWLPDDFGNWRPVNQSSWDRQGAKLAGHYAPGSWTLDANIRYVRVTDAEGT